VCPTCEGDGCEACDDGRLLITACPFGQLDQDVLLLADLAGLYKKGLPPADGGALDQTMNFVAACRFYWNEEAAWKTKLGILDHG